MGGSGNYPTWTRVTAAASTYLSAGMVNNLMQQLSAMQIDMRSLIGSTFSSIASFIHQKQSYNNGNLSSISHTSVYMVSADQHHVKTHTTKHIVGASDAIAKSATNLNRGYETTTQFKRINTMQASSTRNAFKSSKFIGNGATKMITLGYTPSFMKLYKVGSVAPLYDWLRNSRFLIKHNFSAPIHARLTCAPIVVSQGTGIKLKGELNTLSAVYWFWIGTDYV